jgi:GTP-binding protein
MERQDQAIFWQIVNSYRGVVIVVNKWDLVEKTHSTMAEFEANIRERLQPFTDVPILFTSNLTKQRILKAFEAALKVYQNRGRKVATSKLNDFFAAHYESSAPAHV